MVAVCVVKLDELCRIQLATPLHPTYRFNGAPVTKPSRYSMTHAWQSCDTIFIYALMAIVWRKGGSQCGPAEAAAPLQSQLGASSVDIDS